MFQRFFVNQTRLLDNLYGKEAPVADLERAQHDLWIVGRKTGKIKATFP